MLCHFTIGSSGAAFGALFVAEMWHSNRSGFCKCMPFWGSEARNRNHATSIVSLQPGKNKTGKIQQ